MDPNRGIEVFARHTHEQETWFQPLDHLSSSARTLADTMLHEDGEWSMKRGVPTFPDPPSRTIRTITCTKSNDQTALAKPAAGWPDVVVGLLTCVCA